MNNNITFYTYYINTAKGSARGMEICMQKICCFRDGSIYLLITC